MDMMKLMNMICLLSLQAARQAAADQAAVDAAAAAFFKCSLAFTS